MIYFSKRHKILFIVFVTIFIFIALRFNCGIRQGFYFFLRPGTFLINQGRKISLFINSFTQNKVLLQENSFLRKENNKLISELISLKVVKKENEDLRRILNLKLNQKFNLVLCQIREKDISQNSLLINKGHDDGLYSGLPVIDSSGVLFGWLTNVYDKFSVVQLITNKKSSFSVEILDKNFDNPIEAMASGSGSNYLQLKFVPHNRSLSVGDTIVSSYLNKNLPEGLLVGKISKINKIATNPFQEVIVIPLFNIVSAKELFIIANY